MSCENNHRFADAANGCSFSLFLRVQTYRLTGRDGRDTFDGRCLFYNYKVIRLSTYVLFCNTTYRALVARNCLIISGFVHNPCIFNDDVMRNDIDEDTSCLIVSVSANYPGVSSSFSAFLTWTESSRPSAPVPKLRMIPSSS